MYDFCKRGTAWVLLITLLLQSCYNPYLGKKELIPQPASNKGITIQETEVYTESLPNPSLSTGRELQLNESDQDNLALIEAMDPILIEGNDLQASGTAAFRTKDSPQQKALKQLKPQQKSSEELIFKRPALLQGQKRLSRSQQRAKHKDIPSPATQALEEKIKPAGQLVFAIPIVPSTLTVREQVSIQPFVAKGGHQVRFQKLASGEWQAIVEESLPVGISRKLLMPVYTLSGYTIATLFNKSAVWQKNHIQVVLDKTKNYVLVGSMGLPGGMYQDESEDEEEQKEALSYDIAPSVPNLNTPTEFTSDKGLTYQIFKNITFEIAREVEEQTGQVILLKPGKTSTGFTIGRGNFGELRLGKEKISGQYYGIKILSPDRGELAEARAEARLQLKLTGLPHLMPLVDAGEANEEEGSKSTVLYQVMPLAALGNGEQLAAYLQTIKDPAFKEALLVHVAKSILEGFTALHNLSEPIAHLDFKPANLVIDKQGEVYIIDFGCSVYLHEKDQVQEISSGDKNYFSPERNAIIYSPRAHFNGKSSDSWAIGLSMLELATGMVEFKEGIGSTNPEWYVTEHPFLQNTAPGSYASIVKGFLTPDEKDRLTAEEALSLPIFEEDTRPEVLRFLKEFVQNMQSNTRKGKIGGEIPGLTSVQQLPLPHFAGYASRPELEEAVISQLQGKAPLVACVGMGGVGKTQLLTYLVHSKELQQGYKHIYWFQAADKKESLLQQYHGLAQELKLRGVDEKTPVEEAKKALLGFLEKEENSTLLVFDNADDQELLERFLPKDGCQTLVSSRSPNWKNKVAVEVFTPEQVGELLTKLLPGQKMTLEEARLLGEVLGYLPLALNQAIAWIRQEQTSIGSYVTTYEEKQKELLKTSRQLFGKSLPNSMITLYQMQLEKLEEICPEAISLLEYTSLLAPDNIPLALLSKGLLGKATPAETYEKAQEALLQYALWQEDKGTGSVRIHRLMQEVVKLPFTEEKLKERYLALGVRISEEYTQKTTVLADEARQKILAPHLEALQQLAEKNHPLMDCVEFGDILYCIGLCYDFQKGDYAKACTLFEQALEIGVKHYGANDPSIGGILANLGTVYGSLGNYGKSKELLEKALEIIKKHYGADNPSIGGILLNLGIAYGSLGNYGKSKELLKRALKIHIKHHGADHPSTGRTLENLGNAYARSGNYGKSKELLKKALIISIKHYGEDHPSTAFTLANLGNAYGRFANYGKKKELLEKAVEIMIKYYGADHLSTGMILVGLAQACEVLEDTEKALECYEQAYTIYVTYNHPDAAEVKRLMDKLTSTGMDCCRCMIM